MTSAADENSRLAAFAARGASVPFTTPALASARLRCGETDSVDFIIPSLSGAKGTYVVPAKAMAETFILTPHDRALLTELAESGATSPYTIRLAALKVASSGIAGARAAAAAKAFLVATDNLEMVSRLFVVVRTLKAMSISDEPLAAADLMTDAGKKRGRAELAAVAERLGIELDVLLDRVERWGSLIAPLGVADSAMIGPMRLLCQRLAGLAREMRSWVGGDWAGDVGPDAVLIGEMAGETNRLAVRLIGDLDRVLDNIARYLVAWEETEPRLEATMDELAWCLDGWDQVLKIWDATDRDNRARQREVVVEMIRCLPMLPESESNLQQDGWAETALSTRRRVRPLEDWRTGAVDPELTERLERYWSKGE